MPRPSKSNISGETGHFFLVPGRWKAVGLFHTPKGPPTRVNGTTAIRGTKGRIVIEGTIRFAADPGRKFSSVYRLQRTAHPPRWKFDLTSSSSPTRLAGTALATDAALTLVSQSRNGRQRGIETVLWRSAGIAQVVGAFLEQGEIQMTWEITLVKVGPRG